MTKCLCGLLAQSCWGLIVLLLTSPSWSAPPEVSVQFARDIAPILSDNCYQCHGPDAAQREGELRLDLREGLFERRDSSQVVTPGSRAASHLWSRITAKDNDERMPPRDSGKSLNAEQVALIGRWIDQGADWQGHWSFIKPRQAVIPVTGEKNWGHNAIDRFVLSRLEQEQLQPSPEAKRETLIRRVTLDSDWLAAESSLRLPISWRINLREPTSGWSIACWRLPSLVNAWLSSGWTQLAMQIPVGTRPMVSDSCGVGETG